MDGTLASAYLADVLRTFRNQKALAEAALAQVSDAALHHRLDEEANSLAMLMAHLSGNLRSRFTYFLTSDGEKPDRDRDAEFEPPVQPRREDLVAAWDEAWATALESLGALVPEDLGRTVTIRHEPFLVVEALNRLATHTAYHVGQIVLLARHACGPGWHSLTIPRGQSRQARVGTFKQGIVRQP